MKKKGFTLIELLVVVAIIAVMIAILLPALNQVREISKRSVCLNNQKQLATVLIQYAGEFRDRFPPSDNNTNASLSFYLEVPIGYTGLGILYQRKYLPDVRQMFCPSQRVIWFTYPLGWEGWYDNDRKGYWRYGSYYYRFFSQVTGTITPADIAALQRTTLTNVEYPIGLAMDICGYISGNSWAHQNPFFLNVCFSDGHAEGINTGEDIYRRAVYWNNTSLEGYRSDGYRDPFVYAMWKALDRNNFSDVRANWSLP